MLVTHGHGDHVVDVEAMASRYGVPLLRWPELTDGQVVTSGGLEITAMHTPGHCTDHVAFLVNGTDCFTADVLFKGTVGGTAGGGPTGYADIKTSIMDRLMSLDPATVVHPGHTLPTTIGEEWESNPFIRVGAASTRRATNSAWCAASRRRWCCGRPTMTAPTRLGCGTRTGATRSSAGPR